MGDWRHYEMYAVAVLQQKMAMGRGLTSSTFNVTENPSHQRSHGPCWSFMITHDR